MSKKVTSASSKDKAARKHEKKKLRKQINRAGNPR